MFQLRHFTMSMLLMLIAFASNAQLTGTKTIPTDYATVAAFVTDVNLVGVGIGGVQLNVPAGYTETLSGQLTLTTTGTSANPIVIQKSGTGANPILTSYVGANTPTSASRDGMLCLSGSDYVTIDGINFQESAANTTELTCMEYAIGLFKVDAIDGAQNNTIKNCVITLNRLGNSAWTGTGHNGSCGIVMLNCTNAANAGLTPTAASGSNSNNKFESNTIQNVNAGIVFAGYAAPSPFTLGDQLNVVGGSAIVQGNTILNFGGSVAAANPSSGVFASNQWDMNCSYNTINNNNGSGVNHVNTLRGIFLSSSSTSASVNCNFNTISMYGGGTTTTISGIENSFGSTAASNTVNINNNTITGSYITATTGAFNGIVSTSTPANLNMLNNSFTNFTYGDIANTGTGQILGIANQGNATNVVIRNNIVNNIARTGSQGGSTWGVISSSGSNVSIKLNTISNISISGLGTANQIMGIQGGGTLTAVMDSNTVFNLNCLKTTSTSFIYGIYNAAGSVNENYNYNTVYGLNHQGAGTLYGMFFFTTTGVRTVSNNLVHTLNTLGTTISGIQSTSSSPTIFNNKIYNVVSNNTGATTVSGIAITSLGTSGVANVYNNVIGDLRAPNANTSSNVAPSIRGINLSAATATSSLNIRQNTVFINATSVGTNFTTAALFHAGSTTATTANLTIQNNIFHNTSVPNGTGVTSAFIRSTSTGVNMNNASNRNDFFSGQPAANSLIYFDGTNSNQTVAAFQALFPTMGANSISVLPNYVSTTGSASTFLLINSAIATLLESGGVSGLTVTTDIDGDIRQGNAGYLGTGSLPDIGADEFEGTVPPACSGTPVAGTISGPASLCVTNSATLSLPTATNALNITYVWKSSTVAGGPYTNVGTISTYFTGNLTATTYYVADVTCSGSTVTTPEYTLIVNPNPVVTVTGANDVCIGSSIALTASGANTYVWSPATGLSATTGTTVNASPTIATTYTIVGTTTATGCFSSTTKAVAVKAVPGIGSATASPNAVCSGGSSQLNVTVNPENPSLLNFTSTAGTYTETVGGTVLGVAINDDDVFLALPIGFSFNYNGTAYTTFSVNANGFVGLGSTLSSSYTAISSGASDNVIAGFNGDLQANTTTGSLTYLTSGVAPNRVLTVQFKSYRAYAASADNYNFQIKLYEVNKSIQVVYGTMVHGGTASTRQIGLRGTTNAVFNNRSTTTDYSATTPGTINSASCAVTSTVVPASGLTYTWSYPTYTYAWTPTGTLNNSTIANPMSTNILATTPFNVVVTNSVGCSSNSSVTVTSGTTLTSSASISPSPTVCAGTNVTLNSTPIGGGGPYTYAWTGPAGYTSTVQNPVITGAAVANSGAYSVTITDACLASTVQNLTLTVNALPIVSVSPSSASFCSGSAPVALTASGANTYVWSPSAGLSATTGATVNATPFGTTTYTVVGTNTTTGCIATTTATINYGAAFTPTAAALPAAICNGSTSQLTANVQLTADKYLYSESTGTYTPITGGTVLGVATNDDDVFVNNTIGFNFNYLGTAYTNFSVNANGIVALGATISNSYNGLSSGATNNVIAALSGDLQGNTTTGELSYLTTGTAPNRVLTVQFTSYRSYAASGDDYNFQIKLYETTNTIQVVYGAFTQNATARTREVGIRGAAITDFNNRTTTTNWSATTRGTLNSASCALTTTVKPTSGKTFTWSVPTYTYAWSPAGSLATSTGATVTTTAITATTVYTVTATSSLGCTSSAPVTVTVKQPTSASVSVTNCGSYTWPINSVVYSASGAYTATIPNSVGCDSVITLNLTVNPLTTSSITAVACGTYTAPSGAVHTTSGTYLDTIQSSTGCPVVITIALTINNSTASTISPVVCNTYTAPNGTVYTSSGTYTAMLTGANGCDSIVTINLTVNHSSTMTISPVVCGTYTSPGGTVHTTSGTFSDTLTSASGCDSIIVVNLTVNNNTTATISPVACVTYTSPAGTVYTASGTYTNTIPNAAGCDSVITINLTINTPTTSSITITSCGAYTAPSGAVYTASGTYTDMIVNAAGCDSIITINLTLTPALDMSVTVTGNVLVSNEVGATYQWIDCSAGNAIIVGATNQTYTTGSNGSYAVIVTKGSCPTDTSVCTAVTAVGLSDLSKDLNIVISPNPTNDFVRIQYSDLSELSIEVMDVQGKIVYAKTAISNGEIVDLSNFNRGMYLIRLTSDKGTTLERVMKN